MYEEYLVEFSVSSTLLSSSEHDFLSVLQKLSLIFVFGGLILYRRRQTVRLCLLCVLVSWSLWGVESEGGAFYKGFQ